MSDYSNLLISKYVDQCVMAYNKPIVIVGGLYFRQREVIRMIEFYTNSKYLEGNRDELGPTRQPPRQPATTN